MPFYFYCNQVHCCLVSVLSKAISILRPWEMIKNVYFKIFRFALKRNPTTSEKGPTRAFFVTCFPIFDMSIEIYRHMINGKFPYSASCSKMYNMENFLSIKIFVTQCYILEVPVSNIS